MNGRVFPPLRASRAPRARDDEGGRGRAGESDGERAESDARETRTMMPSM